MFHNCSRVILFAVVGAVWCNGSFGEDLTNIREELKDVRARVAALSGSVSPNGGGDAESITTMQKKGAIRIGGDVNVDLIVKRRDDGTTGRENDEVDSTEFHTNSANLRFKIEASANTYLYVKLDLDDFWDQTTNQDDLLEEVKFVWNNVRQSNWGLVFGKGEVPYGQDKSLGVIQSYHHNANMVDSEGPIILTGATEENTNASVANPYQNRGRTAHPGEVDNAFMVCANYMYKDLLMFEMAVFQNNDTTGGGRLTRGMHEDNSDDNFAFQSIAARIWARPVEGLRMELSFIKMHNASAGDQALRTDLTDTGNAREDQYAVSFGFDYKINNIPLEVFGEYEHGWNWNYNDDYDTDTVQLGVVLNVNKSVDLWLVGEWLGIDDDDARADEDYYKAVAGVRYRFDNGIYMILEYAHEWWDGDFANSRDLDGDADVVAFRSGWAF